MFCLALTNRVLTAQGTSKMDHLLVRRIAGFRVAAIVFLAVSTITLIKSIFLDRAIGYGAIFSLLILIIDEKILFIISFNFNFFNIFFSK